MRMLKTGLCLFLTTVMACGGAASQRSAKAPGAAYGGAADSVAATPADEAAPAEPGAPPPSPGTMAPEMRAGADAERTESESSDDDGEADPARRPGLATKWGESMTSRVHDVSFSRADEHRPFATASIHYNDARGARALAELGSHNGSRSIPTGGGAVSLSILGEGGSPLDVMRSKGRTIVIGREGERYSIVLRNNTGHRFEAVASVDGLDVINGRPATLTNRGYVLNPFATLEIEGFRQSRNAVAAFRFSKVSDSYAAKTSGARNVGVIGVALFSEQGDDFDPFQGDEVRRRQEADPFPLDTRFARPPRN